MKTDQNILLEQFGRGKLTVSERSNNCVIYTRVSTKEQADNNMSLETQRKACEQFALKNGYSIMGTFGGTYESAKTDERKEFNRMLSFVKRTKEKICYIIVYSVDRFSRSGANAIYIKEQLRGQGILIMAVSQPTDSATPSGSLQQNIQFIFSEYDNQLRREKCIAGTKEALMRGEWCSAIPVGYDRIYTNGKRSIIVNKDGKLFRKAFLWKANEGISNEEIKKRLEALGLRLTHQRISEALRNPFYCGMMAHRLLEGKLIEGSHEKLISRELFLKANEILSENPRGYTCNPENDKVPLKVYLKCECCGSIMSGYIVKAKNLWYYKCKKKGCGNNKSANHLHGTFTEILASMMVKPKYRTLLKTQMIRTFNKSNKENAANAALLKRNYEDISHKIERLEERYVLEEITQDIYLKYRERFKQERLEIYKRLQESGSHRSNLEEIVETVLDYAGKLPETWVNSPFSGKQKLQNVVFPAGITYNKKTDRVRTTLLNPTFCWIAQQQQEAGHEKSGISQLGLSYAALVVPPGIEPGTQGFSVPCFALKSNEIEAFLSKKRQNQGIPHTFIAHQTGCLNLNFDDARRGCRATNPNSFAAGLRLLIYYTLFLISGYNLKLYLFI